jgi:hypothetical protein
VTFLMVDVKDDTVVSDLEIPFGSISIQRVENVDTAGRDRIAQ